MRFLFHVGMGKTGSTTIQHALAQSGAELAAEGIRYAGMWAPWIGPEHDGSMAFHRFLALPPDRLREAADRCLDWAEALGAETGAHTILHSNEAFHAAPFFRRLAERAEVRLVAYVRAPARWLPSAYMQWGVVHKTNLGAVAPFGATGRRLMAQYRAIRVLGEAMGDLFEARAYPEGGDVLDDFGEVLGLRLRRPPGRLQVRPGPVEAIFRAAFNSAVQEPTLPRAFNEAMRPLRGPQPPAPVSARARLLFDRSELPRILEENAELLAWFDRAHELDLADPGPGAAEGLETAGDGSPPGEGGPRADASLAAGELVDGLLGALVELSVAQGRELAALRARLAEVERRIGEA